MIGHCIALFDHSCNTDGSNNWMRDRERGFIGYGGLGFAGAVTAGACVLCAAGTYHTGSGPPLQQRIAWLLGYEACLAGPCSGAAWIGPKAIHHLRSTIVLHPIF
jgi:hypothetical protein